MRVCVCVLRDKSERGREIETREEKRERERGRMEEKERTRGKMVTKKILRVRLLGFQFCCEGGEG